MTGATAAAASPVAAACGEFALASIGESAVIGAAAPANTCHIVAPGESAAAAGIAAIAMDPRAVATGIPGPAYPLPTPAEIMQAMIFNGIFGKPGPKFVIASAFDPQRAATQCPPIGIVRLPPGWRAHGDDWALTLLVHEIGHWKQCLFGQPVEECVPSYTAAAYAERRGWINLARAYEDYAKVNGCARERNYTGS